MPPKVISNDIKYYIESKTISQEDFYLIFYILYYVYFDSNCL